MRGGARLWWRVVAAGMKWMATRDAFYGEPATAHWAVRREAGGGIARTSGLESATRTQKGRNCALVEPNESQKELAHGSGNDIHDAGSRLAECSNCASTFLRRFSTPRHCSTTV